MRKIVIATDKQNLEWVGPDWGLAAAVKEIDRWAEVWRGWLTVGFASLPLRLGIGSVNLRRQLRHEIKMLFSVRPQS